MPETTVTFAAGATALEGRRLRGLLLPWAPATPGDGRRWKFRRGSVDTSAQWPVKVQHSGQTGLPVGLAGVNAEVDDREDGLHLSLVVPDTGHGRDVAALVRDGILGGLSAELKITETAPGDADTVTAATLVGAALVPTAAYPSAAAEVFTQEFDGGSPEAVRSARRRRRIAAALA